MSVGFRVNDKAQVAERLRENAAAYEAQCDKMEARLWALANEKEELEARTEEATQHFEIISEAREKARLRLLDLPNEEPGGDGKFFLPVEVRFDEWRFKRRRHKPQPWVLITDGENSGRVICRDCAALQPPEQTHTGKCQMCGFKAAPGAEAR